MYLTEHFTFEELIASESAQRQGIDNTPHISLDANLRRLAEGLEDVRSVLGKSPVIVTSGYRCPQLNKFVGGQPNSAHIHGLAADFICPGFGTPRKVCQAIIASGIKYNQIIWEYGAWTHIAFPPDGMAAQLSKLIIDRGGQRDWS